MVTCEERNGDGSVPNHRRTIDQLARLSCDPFGRGCAVGDGDGLGSIRSASTFGGPNRRSPPVARDTALSWRLRFAAAQILRQHASRALGRLFQNRHRTPLPNSGLPSA